MKASFFYNVIVFFFVVQFYELLNMFIVNYIITNLSNPEEVVLPKKK